METNVHTIDSDETLEDELDLQTKASGASTNALGECPMLNEDVEDSYLEDAEVLHLKSERLRRARHYIEDRRYVAGLHLDDFDYD